MSVDEAPVTNFFTPNPIEVGQEVAVYHWGEWNINQVIEVDSAHQRVRCFSARGIPFYHEGQTKEERQKPLEKEARTFWYHRNGQVLSERTWKPLTRSTPDIDVYEAGQISLLTDELFSTMRLAQKRRELSYLINQRLSHAVKQDWRGNHSEARIDFILERLETVFSELVTQFGENGLEQFYRSRLHCRQEQERERA